MTKRTDAQKRAHQKNWEKNSRVHQKLDRIEEKIDKVITFHSYMDIDGPTHGYNHRVVDGEAIKWGDSDGNE